MISRAWRASSGVGGNLKVRAGFVAAAMKHRRAFELLMNPPRAMATFIKEHPQAVGYLIWPYQCASWGVQKRLDRLAGHFEALDRCPGLLVEGEDKIVLADVSDISEGVRIILDRAPWLLREGLLALNIFDGNFRAYSVAFSLFEDEIFIGGIQGRRDERALDLYRRLTKDFHGMRPRDLLLEMLRMVAGMTGTSHMHAVADEHRYFRHRYFRAGGQDAMKVDYNAIWEDRGGQRVAPTHYELPLQPSRRQEHEISAKKRVMYRRRYAMLNELSERLSAGVDRREMTRFAAT